MRARATGLGVVLCALVMCGTAGTWAVTGSVAAQSTSEQPTAPPDRGTTSVSSASTGDTDVVRERAAAFWAARVSGDYAKQWELLEPRARGRMTVQEYATPRNVVKYLAYQVEDAKVEGFFAKVRVRLVVQPTLPFAPQRRVAPSAAVVEDPWVKVQGTWYHATD
jgi:hypothetical protein